MLIIAIMFHLICSLTWNLASVRIPSDLMSRFLKANGHLPTQELPVVIGSRWLILEKIVRRKLS